MKLVEIIPVAASVATAIAALLAVFVAFRGLHIWREQIEGSSQYETVRRLLRALHSIREGVWFVRSSTIREWEELRVEPETENATPNQRSRLRAVHENRWRSINAPFSELEVSLIDAETFWSPGFSNEFDPLRTIIHELGLNLNYYVDGVTNSAVHNSYATEGRWKLICEIAISQGTREQPDAFQRRFNEILDSLVMRVRQRMPLRRSTWWRST